MMKEKQASPHRMDERREHPRLSVEETRVHLGGLEMRGIPANLSVIRTQNLSLGGLRLELKGYYPVLGGSTLELGLNIGNEILRVKGRVIYVQRLEEGRSALGMQFTDIGPDARKKIADFLCTTAR